MAFYIPDDLDALLTRKQTGAALRASGFPVADKTLSTMATRGNGPPYHYFGARVLYRWGDVLDWARSRLSARRVHNTSEVRLARGLHENVEAR